MTKKEALEKIKELEDYIMLLDAKVGYKDDNLFLLSIEEYEKYIDVIPKCKTEWWLRSSDNLSDFAAYVVDSCLVYARGCNVYHDTIGIRPALKINTYDYKIGDTIIYKKFPFTVIDKGLCIATVPITFDKFDGKSNNYETSEVRKFLLKKAGIKE